AQLLRMAAAEPDRFLVVRNEDRSLAWVEQEIFELVAARLEGRPAAAACAPRPVPLPVRDVEQGFFDAVDELALGEPWVALYLLTGIPGPSAHLRRLRHKDALPRSLAASLSDLRAPASMELRHLLLASAPAEIAASLRSDPGEEAMQLRGLAFERAPGPVLASLARNGSAAAWALREEALSRGWLDGVLP